MSKESVPIYQIPDFEKSRFESQPFYYSRFREHLKAHKFIQHPHKHDFYIVLLITQGTGSHSIDFRTYPVEAGSVFFLSPGQVHFWQLSEDCEGYILFFGKEFYGLGFSGLTLFNFPFFGLSHQPPFLQVDVDQSKNLAEIFIQIEKEVQHSNWSKVEYLRSLTEILLITTGRIYRSVYQISTEETKAIDRKILLETTIEAHFRSNHQASFYSESLHLSLRQLNLLCKTNYGKSISQLLLDRIILEAQRLLTYSGDSIAEVASKLGFEDPSYFSRLFKKKTGFSPENFRKSVP